MGKALEIISGYIDEYKTIIATERVKKADLERYEFVIIVLESIKKDLEAGI